MWHDNSNVMWNWKLTCAVHIPKSISLAETESVDHLPGMQKIGGPISAHGLNFRMFGSWLDLQFCIWLLVSFQIIWRIGKRLFVFLKNELSTSENWSTGLFL